MQACKLIASNFQQMSSFTGIFQGFCLDFKNTVLSPPCYSHVLTQALSIKFWRSLSPMGGHSPHIFNTCGKPRTFCQSSYQTILKLSERYYHVRHFLSKFIYNNTGIFGELLPNNTTHICKSSYYTIYFRVGIKGSWFVNHKSSS